MTLHVRPIIELQHILIIDTISFFSAKMAFIKTRTPRIQYNEAQGYRGRISYTPRPGSKMERRHGAWFKTREEAESDLVVLRTRLDPAWAQAEDRADGRITVNVSEKKALRRIKNVLGWKKLTQSDANRLK